MSKLSCVNCKRYENIFSILLGNVKLMLLSKSKPAKSSSDNSDVNYKNSGTHAYPRCLYTALTSASL